jgi:hypothetical protein
MKKKNNPDILARLAGRAVAIEIVCLALIFIFTKSAIYCIISITGAAISITGFMLLIKSTDRLLKKGKGKTMFFLLAPAKLVVIAGTFYLFSRLAPSGVIFFVQGIAVIYVSVLLVGLMKWIGNLVHGT